MVKLKELFQPILYVIKCALLVFFVSLVWRVQREGTRKKGGVAFLGSRNAS